MRKLRYDWQRIERLVAELGENFDAKISDAVRTNDLDTLALAVSIGCDDGATVDEIKAESPAIVPTVQAVMTALNVAFHGTKEAPAATGDENPPWWVSLWRRVKRLFGRV